MTVIRISQVPLDFLRDLLVFDRWLASRALEGEYRTDTSDVNPLEQIILAFRENKVLADQQPDIVDLFTLDEDQEVDDLVGAGDDLGLALNSGSDGLVLDFPGFLHGFLNETRYEDDVSSFSQSSVDISLQDLNLRPGEDQGSIDITWDMATGSLLIRAEFESDDVEIVGSIFFGLMPVEVDWEKIQIDIRFVPRVVQERLLWDHQVDVLLYAPNPGPLTATAETNFINAVRQPILKLLDQWGTYVMAVLMALPLRPMPQNEFWKTLRSMDFQDLGLRIIEQFYKDPPGALWREGLINACLLPHYPVRMIWADLLPEPGIDIYRARLADHFARHVDHPLFVDTGGKVELRFDVEPILDENGSERAITEEGYGIWAPNHNDVAVGVNNDARHVVSREQFLIILDHLPLNGRSYALSSGAGPWEVRWSLQVRHARLGKNNWATLREGTVELQSNNSFLLAENDVRFYEWLDVGGRSGSKERCTTKAI